MVKTSIPKNLAEALSVLSKEKYRLVAGGTDMLVQNRNRATLPIKYKDNVMYIANLEELFGITEDEETIYIGACEPLEAILENDLTPKLLKETILEMASPAIRHTGTLGGNIGNASPAGDSLVPLYLLNAVIEVKSETETRRLRIQDFIQGVRKIDLADNELITKIIISKTEFTKAYFKKVGPRLSDAISKLSFAGAITFDNDIILDLRFAFGAVNITVVRRPEIECLYIRKTKEELKASVNEIVEAYSKFIRPIDDQRSNKEYRKKVSINLLKSFIEEL